jgi:hypothetical protein
MPAPHTSRRRFLCHSLAASMAVIVAKPGWLKAAKAESGVIDIGSRRELLVDDFLIDKLVGVELTLHKPEARNVVLTCDAPWEGNVSAYYTIFEDDGLFRAYYRAWHFDGRPKTPAHPAYTCYAESRDGLTWTKPELGLVEFKGSKANNIIQADPDAAQNFVPFKDNHPACAANARYKALAGGMTMLNGKKKACLHAYQSADGIHWSKMTEEAAITAGSFDSQNLAFWDAERGEYRAYWRIFSNNFRAIRTATSKDFIHWENQADLTYGDASPVHLYTNAILPYFRAPHLLIGFPTHYLATPKEQVEPDFMTSRNAVNFRRWEDPIIPTTAPKDRDGNRSNYMAYGLLQLPGQTTELSVFATEAYYTGTGSRVRRFVYRVDGFVSASAGAAGGTLTSKPVAFAGSKLSLNLDSKGGTRVELQDANGKPLPGFTLEDCTPITGDFIDHRVSWKGGDLSSLAGNAVRLWVELKEAALYSFQFQA